MHQFSQAWKAAQAAYKTGELHDDLKPLKWSLKALISGDEPPKNGKVLDSLRDIINRKAKQVATSASVPLHEATGRVIVQYAGTAASKNTRAAMLKMLYHLYMVGSSGSQALWVYAPPTCYSKWIFSEVKNITDDNGLITVIGKDGTEVYSAKQRSLMLQSVLTAKALCLNAHALAATADSKTLDLIRNYFATAATTESQLKTIASRLAKGYQLMAFALNRGVVIISDEPKDRAGGGWGDFALAYIGENMCVIYVQGGMLAKVDSYGGGDEKSLMRTARTIVHETSHKAVHTDDVIYGSAGGLKVEGSSTLTPEYAIANADSWAYFCADINDKLRPSAKVRARTAAPAILGAPTTTLAV
jgi:hypothetical protein